MPGCGGTSICVPARKHLARPASRSSTGQALAGLSDEVVVCMHRHMTHAVMAQRSSRLAGFGVREVNFGVTPSSVARSFQSSVPCQ
jgi:hypothetical protein